MSPGGTGQPNNRTREDSATQPMDAGWLSFAMKHKYHLNSSFEPDLSSEDIVIFQQSKEIMPQKRRSKWFMLDLVANWFNDESCW